MFEWIPETRFLTQRLFNGFLTELKTEALRVVSELKSVSRDYSLPIKDNYESLDDVTAAIRKAGVESYRLMVFLDFTRSNEYQGAKTFGGRNLHEICGDTNPYEDTMNCISQTLSEFDDENMVPFYIFGDSKTKDTDVRCIVPKRGKDAMFPLDQLSRIYREQASGIKMSGPTSFTPCIDRAVNYIKKETSGYHIVLIITDGKTMTFEEDKKAFIEASKYPLSFVIVGVGDGPFDEAKEFDDMLGRKFDNVQFVDYAQFADKGEFRRALFALNALMEIPEQYQAVRQLGYLKK